MHHKNWSRSPIISYCSEDTMLRVLVAAAQPPKSPTTERQHGSTWTCSLVTTQREMLLLDCRFAEPWKNVTCWHNTILPRPCTLWDKWGTKALRNPIAEHSMAAGVRRITHEGNARHTVRTSASCSRVANSPKKPRCRCQQWPEVATNKWGGMRTLLYTTIRICITLFKTFLYACSIDPISMLRQILPNCMPAFQLTKSWGSLPQT